MSSYRNTLIQVTNDGMGLGDEALGHQLITNYFGLLSEEATLPRVIVFYNSGVKLLCKNSPALEALKCIEEKGVQLVACKTCLNHFNVINDIKAGKAGTMMDIIELQKVSDKVISI